MPTVETSQRDASSARRYVKQKVPNITITKVKLVQVSKVYRVTYHKKKRRK